MKKIFIIIILSFCVLGVGYTQFYSDLPYQEKKELAEAYYLVGQQYIKVGKIDKGNDFINMAYRIFPDLRSDDIETGEAPTRKKTEIIGTWQPRYNPVPTGVTAENAVKYHFSKFLRGFFTEDKDTMLEVVDKKLFLPGIEPGIPKAELDARLQYLFLQEDISTIPPSQIADLQSITVKPVDRYIWQASVKPAQNRSYDIESYLPYGTEKLTFYFRVVGESWLIFAFHELPPQVSNIVSPEESIKDTMVACIQAFTSQKPKEASRYFTDPFLNIPFGKEVSREELVATFEGYFENYDFGTIGTQRIDFQIIESTEVTHPGGKAYKVRMDFDTDLGETFPFWESLTGYYLVFDDREEAWRIFAIF